MACRYLRALAGVGMKSYTCSARCFSSASDKFFNIDVDSKTGIATVEMNNAPVNSMDSEVLMASVEVVKAIERENDIRAVILRSKFDGKNFSAGLHILEFYQKSSLELIEFWKSVQDWYISWYGCKKPTAAVINGRALAGGCAFATFCDYRVMQAGAQIGMIETRLGARPPGFVIDVIKALVGHKEAEQALLEGKLYTAEKAKEIGLVHAVDSLENLTSVAKSHLAKLIAIPPAAFSVTKMLLRQDYINKLIKVRREDAEAFASYVIQPEVQDVVGQYLKTLKAKSE